MKDVKNILRNNAKIIRNNIDKETCSAQIVKHILNWSIYKSSHNIMLFYPLGSEISLLELLKDSDKNFYFPVVEDDSIYPVLYDSKKGFKTGKYNIMEPIGEKLSDYSILDLIFVPALAVDMEGFRLGYGKGYYDRFLLHVSDSCNKVVPISTKLIFDKLPRENHDMAVDYIISDKSLIISSASLLSD